MPTVIEFWPEYNSGPLWSTDGQTVAPSSLGLPQELCEALTDWNAKYNDSNLPFESDNREWLGEGTRLLNEVRAALGPDVEVVVVEPWWGEEPSNYPRG